MGGRKHKGIVYITEDGKAKKDFDYWVKLALDFNTKAKASRKRRDKLWEISFTISQKLK